MTARKPLLIAVAAALLACAAFWYLALAPRQERMSALDVEIATERAAAQRARDQLAGHEAARRSYPATYERMVRLGKALPVEDDVRSLLVQLDRAAEASRVNFRTLGVGGQGGGAPAAATPAPGAPSAPVNPGTTPLGGR